MIILLMIVVKCQPTRSKYGGSNSVPGIIWACNRNAQSSHSEEVSDFHSYFQWWIHRTIELVLVQLPTTKPTGLCLHVLSARSWKSEEYSSSEKFCRIKTLVFHSRRFELADALHASSYIVDYTVVHSWCLVVYDIRFQFHGFDVIRFITQRVYQRWRCDVIKYLTARLQRRRQPITVYDAHVRTSNHNPSFIILSGKRRFCAGLSISLTMCVSVRSKSEICTPSRWLLLISRKSMT